MPLLQITGQDLSWYFEEYLILRAVFQNFYSFIPQFIAQHLSVFCLLLVAKHCTSYELRRFYFPVTARRLASDSLTVVTTVWGSENGKSSNDSLQSLLFCMPISNEVNPTYKIILILRYFHHLVLKLNSCIIITSKL